MENVISSPIFIQGLCTGTASSLFLQNGGSQGTCSLENGHQKERNGIINYCSYTYLSRVQGKQINPLKSSLRCISSSVQANLSCPTSIQALVLNWEKSAWFTKCRSMAGGHSGPYTCTFMLLSLNNVYSIFPNAEANAQRQLIKLHTKMYSV